MQRSAKLFEVQVPNESEPILRFSWKSSGATAVGVAATPLAQTTSGPAQQHQRSLSVATHAQVQAAVSCPSIYLWDHDYEEKHPIGETSWAKALIGFRDCHAPEGWVYVDWAWSLDIVAKIPPERQAIVFIHENSGEPGDSRIAALLAKAEAHANSSNIRVVLVSANRQPRHKPQNMDWIERWEAFGPGDFTGREQAEITTAKLNKLFAS